MEERVEVSGPGGWRAAFSGTSGLCIAVLCCVAFLIWFLFGQNALKIDALIEAQAKTREEVRENTETQQVMIYVLTLPQPEREKLNLMRPRKLAEMQR